MDKNRKLKIACSCTITMCLLVISLKYLTDLLELKGSDVKLLPFLEQTEDFDVLFMGSSHVILSIFPMELWNDYGIVSYNMGGHGDRIPTTYWVLENALELTTPRLVVIDCLYLNAEMKTNDIFSSTHRAFDAFPLNMTKLSAIHDLLDDPVMDQMMQDGTARELRERTWMELSWNYCIYHTRWNELSVSDFTIQCSKTKGAELKTVISMPNEYQKISAESKLEGETTGIQYLRKMIEDCQSRGIDVLLTYMPFPASEVDQMDANRVYDIAAEYGVNYLNFLDMDIVDYNTDCYDADSHLNPSGGQKVTEYVGQYITEHYDIPDQRNNPAYSQWYEDYKEYSTYKIDLLKGQESLDLYLMLLADKNYDVEIEIYNPLIWENEYYVKLLKNLGIDRETVTENATENNTDKNLITDVRITVIDKGAGEVIDQTDFTL